VVDFGSERFVLFDVAGRGTDNRLATIHLRGDASRLAAGRYRVSAQATDADAAYWAAYFKAFPQAYVAAGRADVDMDLARLGSKPPPGLPLDMQGHVTLRDATIAVTDKRFLHQPLRHLTGNATFTGAGVAFDGHLSIAEQPLTATGTLFDFKHPQVAATITSALIEPSRLASALPILKLPPGVRVSPGPATVQFTGTPANPAISANVAFPAVFYAGNRATDVRAQMVYVNKILSIPAATFGLNGTGQASLRGRVALTGKTPIVLLAGQARNVDLAALVLPPALARQHLNLGGRADVAFLANSQGHPLSVVANLSAKNLSARGMTLSAARGRVSWSMGGPLTIARAALQDSKGIVIVSGTIPGGQKGVGWNLSVQASHLDLARLSRPFTRLDLAGLADFQGHVGGTASAPQALGDIQLYEPRLGHYGADAVQGALTASTGGIRLENVRIHRFPTEADVSGTITRLASQNPALDLNVKVSQGDVQDFLSLARQVDPAAKISGAPATPAARTLSAALPTLTGTAEGELRITGRLKSPQIAGRAQIADATVGAYRIDRVSANFSYADGGLQVRNGLVQAGGSTVTAEGSRDRQGRLEARVTGREINLNQFYRLTDPYADVAGTVSFTGTVSGTPQSPTVNVDQLSAENLDIDGQQFAPVTLAGRYADGVITQSGAPWEFDVQLPKRQQVDGQTQIRYLLNKFALVLPTPANPNRQASLTLDAQIPAQTPEQVSHLLRTLRFSRFARTAAGKNLLAQIRDLPQPLAGSLSVSQLTVDGPLSAPDIHADLQASNLALGETRVNGLTAKVHYQGGADPSAHLTANADDLLLAGVPIGKAGADADYANRVVSLHSLSASSARAFLQVSGRADLDGKISGTLDASNIPLALFQSFAPNADAAFRVLPREISALSVTASGPTRAPDLVASVSLANPAVASSASDSAATYSLDRIRSGAITLMSATPGSRDKVLAISDLAAFKNGRLVATLSGTLPVQLGAASKTDAAVGLPNQALHADLRVQDLSVLSLFSPGLVDPKKTSGSLVGSVDVVGEGAARRIAGVVTMTNGSVGLVGFDTALQKLGGQVLLDNGRLTDAGFAGHLAVQNFSGQSSKGGGFTLSGTGTLGKGGEANLQMAAKNLSVDETSQKSALVDKFKSGLRGKVTGALTVKGPWLTPRVATTGASPLLISDAVFTLPSAAGTQGTSSTIPAFNPQFDLHMNIGGKGKTIAVRSPLLQADANGDLAIGGELSQPELLGHFSVYKGFFNLPPATHLRFVRPIGVVDLTYPVSLPSPLGGE
ncbi:MAG: translocation/assembly module TamB domain-containing protein, partial [Armatimonadota bacterium]|nr:translocation/assembly module TamB domain-containing protein [Armatimonadota bacterium]